MGPEIGAPAGSVRRQEAEGRGLPRRPRRSGLLTPEICILGALLATVVVGVSLTSESEEGGAACSELGCHAAPVEGVSLAPDGRSVVSAGRDGAVWRWDLVSRRSRRVGTRSASGYSSVVHSPDGSMVAVGGLVTGVTLLDAATGTERETLPAAEGMVRRVAFAPDGKSVASGGDDGLVRIWELGSGRPPLVLNGQSGLITDLAFSPDGRSLAVAAVQGTVLVWDLGGQSESRTPLRIESKLGMLSALAFSPDGRSLAFGGSVSIVLHELATGRSRTWRTEHRRVTTLRYLSDGLNLVSSGLDGSIVVWDLASSSQVVPRLTLSGHKGGGRSLAISPDDAALISGGNDDAVRVWDLRREVERSRTAANLES